MLAAQPGLAIQLIMAGARSLRGMGPSKVKRMKELEKENQRLRRAVSDLTLDKLILKESLDYLKLND